MQFKGVFKTALSLALLSSMTLGALAQEVNPQVQEAVAFYTRILNNTNNPLIVSLARENLSKLQQAATVRVDAAAYVEKRRFEIPLMEQADSSLAVPGMINRRVMATFLVDTGATYTVITPRLAKKLGVQITPDTPRISIITANGHIKAPLVTLDHFSIGRLELNNVQVVVQDLGNDLLLAGLIGMNFFKGMDLSVRQDRLIVDIRVPSQVSSR